MGTSPDKLDQGPIPHLTFDCTSLDAATLRRAGLTLVLHDGKGCVFDDTTGPAVIDGGAVLTGGPVTLPELARLRAGYLSTSGPVERLTAFSALGWTAGSHHPDLFIYCRGDAWSLVSLSHTSYGRIMAPAIEQLACPRG